MDANNPLTFSKLMFSLWQQENKKKDGLYVCGSVAETHQTRRKGLT